MQWKSRSRSSTPSRPMIPIAIFGLSLLVQMLADAASIEPAGHTAVSPSKPTSPPEPAGYRIQDYRAPVPNTLRGATVVSNEKAIKLWGAGKTIFIDVLPLPPRPKGLSEGTVWRSSRRDNIPGSHWIANVGFGVLNPNLQSYFQRSLAILTSGKKTTPILFYCLADCWMSWNAAKRALALGYKKVFWYPAGTDGWVTLGGRLERSEPVPFEEPKHD